MRKLIAILAVVLFSVTANAQWSTQIGTNGKPDIGDYGRLYTFTATVDSTDTLTESVPFTLGEYMANNYSTNPLAYSYYITSALGVPHVDVRLQISNDGTNWTIADTLVANDSAETQVFTYDNPTTHKPGFGKALFYRLWVRGTATATNPAASINRSDTYLRLYLLVTQKPYK